MPPTPTNTGRNPEYLRPSPVRGQLEPQSSSSPPGWRHIQTTDTPDEFKVLLPPGTAAMYDYLLKLETYELTKKATINWERLMQIRHLKDRMIRKCQRLGNVSTSSKKATSGGAFVFQSLAAPSDFRLKEMEKWFREQQKRVAAKEAKRVSTHRDSKVPQTRSQALVPVPKPSSVTRPSSTQPESGGRRTHSRPPTERPLRSQRSVSLPTATQQEEDSPQVFSPLPLPMLLVAQREEYGLEPSPVVDPLAGERVDRFIDSEPLPNGAESGANTPGANGDDRTPGGGPLRRRRSALRRSSSDLSKRVSWADAQELDQQISKYAAAARQVQASGTWSEVRTLYLDQIHALNDLHEQVKEGMDQLRLEADHLHRIEETITRQRRSLENTFNDFESKHSQFKAKVREAISEATNNLANANPTIGRLELELPPINETSFNDIS